MIKNLFAFLLITIMFVACNSENKPKDNNKSKNIDKKALTIIDLADFDSKAGDYVGQKVKVKGIVDHVCKHGGKKILLVSDNGDVHINSDKRFDEDLTGKEITVIGIVKEFRVDEAYCLKMENDMIKEHSEGEDNDEHIKAKKAQIQHFRDSMKTTSVDHLSFYDLQYILEVLPAYTYQTYFYFLPRACFSASQTFKRLVQRKSAFKKSVLEYVVKA